jgi:hypothetical protein
LAELWVAPRVRKESQPERVIVDEMLAPQNERVALDTLMDLVVIQRTVFSKLITGFPSLKHDGLVSESETPNLDRANRLGHNLVCGFPSII